MRKLKGIERVPVPRQIFLYWYRDADRNVASTEQMDCLAVEITRYFFCFIKLLMCKEDKTLRQLKLKLFQCYWLPWWDWLFSHISCQ